MLIIVYALLHGCASVTQLPDKAPCTGFVKTNTDCIGTAINKSMKGA